MAAKVLVIGQPLYVKGAETAALLFKEGEAVNTLERITWLTSLEFVVFSVGIDEDGNLIGFSGPALPILVQPGNEIRIRAVDGRVVVDLVRPSSDDTQRHEPRSVQPQ